MPLSFYPQSGATSGRPGWEELKLPGLAALLLGCGLCVVAGVDFEHTCTIPLLTAEQAACFAVAGELPHMEVVALPDDLEYAEGAALAAGDVLTFIRVNGVASEELVPGRVDLVFATPAKIGVAGQALGAVGFALVAGVAVALVRRRATGTDARKPAAWVGGLWPPSSPEPSEAPSVASEKVDQASTRTPSLEDPSSADMAAVCRGESPRAGPPRAQARGSFCVAV